MLKSNHKIITLALILSISAISACSIQEASGILKDRFSAPKISELKLLDIELTNAFFEVGVEKKLRVALGKDGTSRLLAGDDLLWISSEETVISVSQTGNMKALKEGISSLKIFLKDNPDVKIEKTIQVVRKQNVLNISIRPSALKLAPGRNEKLMATVTLADGTKNSAVTWHSSDDTIATVNPTTGDVVAHQEGTASIVAYYAANGSYKSLVQIDVLSEKELLALPVPVPVPTVPQLTPAPFFSPLVTQPSPIPVPTVPMSTIRPTQKPEPILTQEPVIPKKSSPSLSPFLPSSSPTPNATASLSPFPSASSAIAPSPLPSISPSPSPIPSSTSAQASAPAGDVMITLPGGVPMSFNMILPGTFMMGSPDIPHNGAYPQEKPQHQVTLTQGFYMQTTEVTQNQWKAVMGSGNNPSNFKGDSLPVETVSYDDVQLFITTLNGLEKGIYRLPTEAEWEYAARAGTTTDYTFGDNNYASEQKLGEYAWYKYNSGYPGPGSIRPVSYKKPNPWGLYDMYGNVYEWVYGWYRYYSSSPVTDPMGPSSGAFRVSRGGAWNDGVQCCRSAMRQYRDPSSRYNHLGFRLVKQP